MRIAAPAMPEIVEPETPRESGLPDRWVEVAVHEVVVTHGTALLHAEDVAVSGRVAAHVLADHLCQERRESDVPPSARLGPARRQLPQDLPKGLHDADGTLQEVHSLEPKGPQFAGSEARVASGVDGGMKKRGVIASANNATSSGPRKCISSPEVSAGSLMPMHGERSMRPSISAVCKIWANVR